MNNLRLLALAAAVALTGCASGPAACTPGILAISPASVTLDHAAAPPGNQQQFTESVVGGTCARALVIALGPITSSDPINAPSNQTGIITCVGATTVPVTLTTALSSSTATLVCK